MSINSVGYGTSPLALAILNLNNQMTTLSTQLATGEKSTNYAGMGVNEGFAIAARSQLASISAFTDTMSNVNTMIPAANNALQSFSSIGGQVQNSAAEYAADARQQRTNHRPAECIGRTGVDGRDSQYPGRRSLSVFRHRDRYAGDRAGRSDAQRHHDPGRTEDADRRTRAGRSAPPAPGGWRSRIRPRRRPWCSVAEDAAGSPFGLKLSTVSSSLTGATVTGPAGSPAAVSIDLGATNPNPGDKVSFTFNLPDGTTASVALTATTTTPAPTGSFTIGATPTATAANLNTALNSAIGTAGQHHAGGGLRGRRGRQFLQHRERGHRKRGQQSGDDRRLRSPARRRCRAPRVPIRCTRASPPATPLRSTARRSPLSPPARPATRSIARPPACRRLLATINSITGTSTPSTIDGGAIEIHTDDAASLSITSSPAAAMAASASAAPA